MAVLWAVMIDQIPSYNNGNTSVTDIYRVVCEPGDNSNVAKNHMPINLYDAHPVFTNTRVKSCNPTKPGDEGWIWDLAYSYDDQPFQLGVSGGQDPSQLPPPEDPAASDGSVTVEERPWVFTYGAAQVAEPMEFDSKGTILQTVNGEKYSPTLEIERPQRVMRLTCWMPITFPAQDAGDLYQGRVNSDTWGRYAPGEALCTAYIPTTERVQNFDVWRIEIEVTIKKFYDTPDGRLLGGWTPVWVPHRGTQAIYTLPIIGDVLLPVVDREGRTVKEPVYIKISDGKQATLAEIESDPGPDHLNPNDTDLHIPYYTYKDAPFASMLG